LRRYRSAMPMKQGFQEAVARIRQKSGKSQTFTNFRSPKK